MPSTRARAFCAIFLLSAVAPATAQELLANDSFESGQAAAFQGGFIAGEIAAVRLEPTGPCPCPVSRVQFLFGGADTIQTVRLHVWDDSPGTLEPGTELFAADYEIAGFDFALQEIDLSAAGVSVDGPFRVGLEFTHDGAPSIARDADGLTPGRNFILANGVLWVDSSFFAVPGDWIIRALVGDVPPGEPGELRNDGWVTGQQAAFQAGFEPGEIAAVRLVPDEACPCPLSRVRFLFGGAETVQTITLRIWDDAAGTPDPGAELFSDDFVIGGIDEALLEIDLVGRGIEVDGPFRVGIELQHGGLPSIARDDDGTFATGTNFIRDTGGTWVDASSVPVLGDWVIRAVIGELPPASGELKNDGWFTGDTVAFQGGFQPGEIAAARLVPIDPCPCPLGSVRFLFGGAATVETITLHVWDDPGGSAAPGTELFAGSYEIGGIDEALLDIDLRPEDVVVNGPFRIGIELQHSGLPSVARDDDGTIAADRNFVLDGTLGWVEASSQGVLGDWVLRAVLGPDATPLELANDLWQSGQPAVFPSGLLAGDVVGARLVPSTPCPCPVEGARLLFGGATVTETVTLHVWDDSAGTDEPGGSLYSGAFPLQGSDDQLRNLDLGGAGLVVNGPVRVGVELQHSGLPAVGHDEDGIHVDRNFVAPSGSGWSDATAEGVAGDFVIRLVLAPEPGGLPAALLALAALAGCAGRRRRSPVPFAAPEPASRKRWTPPRTPPISTRPRRSS